MHQWARLLLGMLLHSFSGDLAQGRSPLGSRTQSFTRQSSRIHSVAKQPYKMKPEDKKYVADSIRGVPDFPHKGIIFHDVTTLLLDPKVYSIFEVACPPALGLQASDALASDLHCICKTQAIWSSEGADTSAVATESSLLHSNLINSWPSTCAGLQALH